MTTTNNGDRDKMGMSLAQHLRPEAIYRINSTLQEIGRDEIFGGHHLQVSLFDPYKRKFRWLLLDKDDWSLSGVDGFLRALIEKLSCSERREFADECGKYLRNCHETFRGRFLDLLRKGEKEFEELNGLIGSEENREGLHHALMMILQAREFPKDGLFDGLVYRLVRKGSCNRKRLKWLGGQFVAQDVVSGYGFRAVREIKAKFADGSSETTKYYSQDHGKSFADEENLRKWYAEHQPDPLPWHVSIQRAIVRNITKDVTDNILSVPVFDGALAGLECGRLLGIVHILWNGKLVDAEKEKLAELAEGVQKHEERIASSFRRVALDRIERRRLCEKKAREAERQGQSPILHHFLETLPYLQDWESVEVIKGNPNAGSSAVAVAKRVNGGEWKVDVGRNRSARKGDLVTSLPLLDLIEAPGLYPEERDRLGELYFRFEYPDYAIKASRGDQDRLDQMYLQDQIDIWKRVLPRILQYRIRLQSVKTAISAIMGRNMSHNIGSHVLARYASKIGADQPAGGKEDDQRSDLLRYLQRRMDFLADVATSDRAFWFQSLSLEEQINRLNWNEQKKRFTAQESPAEPVTACGSQAKPVLLRFITGKEGLKATVNYSSDDVYFACPGGEVGVHALFVILENIIRNSARHGSAKSDFVTLEVFVQDQDSDLLKLEIIDQCSSVTNEVTLTLAEPVDQAAKVNVRYTKPTGDGERAIQTRIGKPVPNFSLAAVEGAENAECARGTKERMRPFKAVVAGNSLVLTFDKELDTASTPAKEAFSVTANDRPVEVATVAIVKRLDKRINDILEEPILASDGEPKAENWGIREMQICAHYLRRFSLFDLKSAPDEGYAVLTAGCHDNRKLKYTIYLQRAKRMAVVSGAQGGTNSEDEEKLERQGVKIFNKPADSDWTAMGAEVGIYEYLVVESDVGELLPWSRDRGAASLPVRRLALSQEEINNLICEARKGGSRWQEPLHKGWAELTRDKRPAWHKRRLFGVSIGTSDRALPKPEHPWPSDNCTPGDGLIFASKSTTSSRTKPLPKDAHNWLGRLALDEQECIKLKPAIAAAWIDHASKVDFSPRNAGLGQSSKPTPHSRRNYRWISAETARSDDLHTRFLNNAHEARKGLQTAPKPEILEWEILAAAVARVAVLDERVQSAGREMSSVHQICRHKLWRYMGVWTPEKPPNGVCDLDAPDFERCKEFLKEPALRDDQYPIDMLVVHLTILERLARDRNEPLGTVLQCLLADTQAKDAEVVVVTGRGVPAVARAAGGDDGSALEGVRYLPISALLESLVTRPSKLALMRVLWSAGVPTTAIV